MPGKTTGPAIRRRKSTARGKLAADDGMAELSGIEPIASFGHHPRKAIPFASMLGVLITIGLVTLAQTGIREGWGIALLLIVLPGILVASFIRDLMLRGPLLLATPQGLIDRRRGPDTIRWEDIAEATAKNRLFSKGVRLMLTNGEPVEIDLSLLNAEPKDILLLIHSVAERERRAASR